MADTEINILQELKTGDYKKYPDDKINQLYGNS